MRPTVTRACLAALILSAALPLLFYNLGHYALWDDEALTALTAEGVWASGDTIVNVGPSVLAYRGGAMLDGLKERFSPPLQFYLAAPFLGTLGDTSGVARLPFALCGLIALLVMTRWMWRRDLSPVAWTVFGVVLLSTVEAFLFFRQARYYAPAMLFTLLIAYVWIEWTASRWFAPALSVLLCLLWLSSYLNFAALGPCLLIDYALWGRRIRRLTATEWLTILAPPGLLCAVTLSVWNPLPRLPVVPASTWLSSKWHLLVVAFRDLDRNEFYVGALMLAVPLLAWWRRERERHSPLLRGWLAVVVYVAAVAILSPQYRGFTDDSVAFVRFYAPVLMFTIPVGALAVLSLTGDRWWAVPIAAIVFGTTWAHFSPAQHASTSTVALYVRELMHPPTDPYTEATRWLRAHARNGDSVWVNPPYMAYPLMFEVPGMVFGWQLASEKRMAYPSLGAIHFLGAAPVDYVIVFAASQVNADLMERMPWRYARVATLPTLGRDLFRPELEWRSFQEVPAEDPSLGIQIYQLQR